MSESRFTCRVRGFGTYVPERVLTNADFMKSLDTSDEWIVTRTGIRERHVAEDGVTTSDLAYQAALGALEDSGMRPEDITHILFATCTPDAPCPISACGLGHRLGIKGIAALDFNVGCSGFVYGLSLTRAMLTAEPDAKILLVAAERLTTRVNWTDRSTAVLFGDGAGAFMVTAGHEDPARPEPGIRIVDVILKSDGSLGELLTIKGGGSVFPYHLGDTIGPEYFLAMNGREVFKYAVRYMEQVSRDLLERNNLSVDAVDLVIPHQANQRIMEAVASRLGAERALFSTVAKYGNSSASTVPLALGDARKEGRLKPGTRVLTPVFGGGFTWGAALLEVD